MAEWLLKAQDLKSGGRGFKSWGSSPVLITGVVSRLTTIQHLGHACK